MSEPTALKPVLARLAEGAVLTRSEARAAFETVIAGGASEAQLGAFLMAMRLRGEAVAEIAGAAEALRARMLPVKAPEDAIDTCGTGGDAKGTLNVSTAVALVLAGLGVPVAKHGNRAISSRSGGAQVLEALGVRLDIPPARIEEAIAQAGIGFMMAPLHHAAMRHVAKARLELGTRTIFNILGPLANPAGVRRQVVGVASARMVEPYAEVLRLLGSERALVVHGSDGIDELTVSGPSSAALLEGGTIRLLTITPEEAGLARHPFEALLGGDPPENARRLAALLAGARDAYRDIVLLNAAAGLMVAGRAASLQEGAAAAAAALDEGHARAALARLIAITNREA